MREAGMLEVGEISGIRLITSETLARKWGVAVAFTGRAGGISTGRFDSLNLSYNVGDDRRNVTGNRRRLGEALGAPPESWTMCRQVHGSTVSEAGALQRGRGGLDHLSGVPRTDALVARFPGTAVGILTADCVPLIMVEPRARCAAAVHAGWRGVLAGVAPKALGRLIAGSGRGAGDVVVFIGPHIRSCCMVVGEEVATRFRRRFAAVVLDGGPAGGSPRLDLGEALAVQLESAGIHRGSVHTWGECTCCGEGYFSHRASGGAAGRQAGMVALY